MRERGLFCREEDSDLRKERRGAREKWRRERYGWCGEHLVNKGEEAPAEAEGPCGEGRCPGAQRPRGSRRREALDDAGWRLQAQEGRWLAYHPLLYYAWIFGLHDARCTPPPRSRHVPPRRAPRHG